MIYKDFQDIKLSTLGMGTMRLPVVGERGPIDEEKAMEMIDWAYQNGVNYFDTAYRYHNGDSETFVGKALKRYPRDSWYLASKMPGHMMKYENGKLGFTGYLAGHADVTIADIFEEQLEKCGVDYFDFYLLHNLCETSYDFYTNEELGVVKYLLEQKEKGRIRHLGLSSHGRADIIDRFLAHYDCFEFVQIQLNYMDWTLQDAKSKYQVIYEKHGLPVIVMEPVRGGKLASLNAEADAMLKKARPEASIASWAFRFLQSLPGVLVTLSGMTTMEQLKDNLKTYSSPAPLTEEEQKILEKALSTILTMVPCTGCRYCCDGCPQDLDIPKLISLYNESVNGSGSIQFNINGMKPEELPSACLSCGACAQLCPQEIDIPDIMKKFAEKLAK